MLSDKTSSVLTRDFRWRAILAIAFAGLLFLAPPAVSGQVLNDFDNRTGTVAPNSIQLGMVSGLGATATWNEFGTPGSLINYGGYLATGLQGPDAATVARNWIGANKALFRLSSTAGLKVINDAQLAQSDGYVVNFRQQFGSLMAAEDGLLTVGLVGSAASGWKIAYVSSSVTGDETLTGVKQLSAQDAWLKAAANVGRGGAVINNTKADREWTLLGIPGFANVQRVRLLALPTPNNGVRPVYETLVLDNRSGHMTAYTHYVDAANGTIWVRKDLVEQSHPTADAFSGSVGLVDGACAPDNGPWTVDGSESIGSIVVTVAATLPANDAVIHLLRDGNIVASQDTATSPEVLVYDPADSGVGTYTVRVCDFAGDAAPWLLVNTYNGQIVFNPADAQAGFPYPPKWKVFPSNPLIGNQTFPWNYPSTDIRKVWCWESTTGAPPVAIPGCEMQVQNLASRVPWDYNARTNTPTFTTSGNNALTAEAWLSPLTPGPPGQRPFSIDRNYDFPWTNAWHTIPASNPPGCSPTNLVPTGNDIFAAVTNLFAMHNRMHDWSYFLGFTERHWNAQDSNFGNVSPGTSEGDPVIGNAQAGAVDGGFPSYLGRDNANMVSLPDGVPSITNMYLWQPIAGTFYAPCVDGDYDMAVIGHEYGHMIENRMIGKGDSRAGHHAGAMGESFGDFDAAEYLNEYNFVPVSGENPFAVGAYVTGNKERAIRNYGMNYPRVGAFPEPGKSTTGSGPGGTGTKVNPLNFSDHGYDITGAQVHADGEIWSAVNFDIRAALVAKYNASFPATDQSIQRECADGARPAYLCPGNRRWIQLVYDAMLLMPVGPSMLEARDAYLAADMMRFGGANQSELWLAFARRGFGKDATSTNGLSDENDADPKPDFQSLVHSNTTVTFKAIASDEGNAAVKARIYVGHYEARVSPIADTDQATGPSDSGSQTAGASNLDNKAGFAEGTYEFVVRADGYGHVRFRETFSGGSKTVTIKMPTNFASMSKGSVATGDGTNHQHLIDDKEGTNWDRDPNAVAVNVVNPQVTVDLGGTTPRTINRAQVSALLEVGQNRFTALRKFKIQTSTNGILFTDWIISDDHTFPGFNPRPVAPEMLLRSYTGPSRQATHIRIIALQNQCTGNVDFQGVQDDDPLNGTDCRQGSPGAGPVQIIGDLPQVVERRDDEVHIAELQVFNSVGGTGGGGGGGGGGGNGGGDCEVTITQGGMIIASNGDPATFGGVARVSLGLVSGQEEYQDHGPFALINVHSINVTMVQCTNDRQAASIFGTATINGSGSFNFQIDVEDNGEPGTADKYRMQVNGYDSGLQTLKGGNVQIH